MKQTEKAVIAGAIIGAVAGAAGAYLYATERGGEWKRNLAQLVDRATADADDVRRLWGQVRSVWARFDEDRGASAVRRKPWTPEGAA